MGKLGTEFRRLDDKQVWVAWEVRSALGELVLLADTNRYDAVGVQEGSDRDILDNCKDKPRHEEELVEHTEVLGCRERADRHIHMFAGERELLDDVEGRRTEDFAR